MLAQGHAASEKQSRGLKQGLQSQGQGGATGGGKSRAGGCQTEQGRAEERERLGEARQLGTWKCELEPEDPHVHVPRSHPRHSPPPPPGSLPLSQCKLTFKNPIMPRSYHSHRARCGTASRSIIDADLPLGRGESRAPKGGQAECSRWAGRGK